MEELYCDTRGVSEVQILLYFFLEHFLLLLFVLVLHHVKHSGMWWNLIKHLSERNHSYSELQASVSTHRG